MRTISSEMSAPLRWQIAGAAIGGGFTVQLAGHHLAEHQFAHGGGCQRKLAANRIDGC
jgi:hypothetical protein